MKKRESRRDGRDANPLVSCLTKQQKYITDLTVQAFRIFMRFFELIKNRERAPRHKTMDNNDIYQKAAQKPLGELSQNSAWMGGQLAKAFTC